MRLLDYATQVSELEKMAKLAPAPVVVRAPPALLPPESDAACLVCSARPARACATCGSVSYCGAAHQQTDARWHDAVCGALRDISEDRGLTDDVLPELLTRVARARDVRALGGWDDLFGVVPQARKRRLSDLATRPLTLARALADLDVSPRAQSPGALGVHVMAAARRELEVPLEAWALVAQLLSLRVELAFVGPELTDAGPLIKVRKAVYGPSLWSELGRPDLVIGYDCGLLMYPSWKSTILSLRGSGVPFVITSFRGFEAAAEARLLSAVGASCLLESVANPWTSLAGKRSSTIANDISFDNAFVSAWR